MNAALSIVLTGMVMMIPLQQVQVQVQAQQPEAVRLYQAASPDNAAHLLRVQPGMARGTCVPSRAQVLQHTLMGFAPSMMLE